MESLNQLQKPIGPTCDEIKERKELNKRKKKKEENGKTLNEQDTVRLEYLKRLSKQFKRDMEEFDAYVNESLIVERNKKVYLPHLFSFVCLLRRQDFFFFLISQLFLISFSSFFFVLVCHFFKAIQIQKICRGFIHRMRYVAKIRQIVLADFNRSVQRLGALGYGKVSITTLAALQVSTNMKVAELQSKAPGGKPMKQEMKFPKQVKTLNLPDPDRNGALYRNITDATKLVLTATVDDDNQGGAQGNNKSGIAAFAAAAAAAVAISIGGALAVAGQAHKANKRKDAAEEHEEDQDTDSGEEEDEEEDFDEVVNCIALNQSNYN
jgi:uncharacterized protein YnzC (UPF0291/DUF896 family)